MEVHPFLNKMKSWYKTVGVYIINFEVLAFIILVILFIFFLRKQWKKDGENKLYAFQGLADKIVLPKQKEKKRQLSSHSKMEEKCRVILEKIYHKKFPSVRPKFLKNPATGQNLELDCYNDQLKIALEYDGKQHSEYNPFFHRNGPKEFLYQAKKDEYKDLIVKREGITLIRVPHFVQKSELETYIKNKLRVAGKL
jgi:very-short-patch-repair endonuclease